jgi:hypothetical protein
MKRMVVHLVKVMLLLLNHNNIKNYSIFFIQDVQHIHTFSKAKFERFIRYNVIKYIYVLVHKYQNLSTFALAV